MTDDSFASWGPRLLLHGRASAGAVEDAMVTDVTALSLGACADPVGRQRRRPSCDEALRRRLTKAQMGTPLPPHDLAPSMRPAAGASAQFTQPMILRPT